MKRWSCLFLMLAGCTEMMDAPTLDQLDWDPPKLSTQNCPDISGRYLAPGNDDYRWIFPEMSERDLHKSREVYLRDKELKVFVTITSDSNGVGVQAGDGKNQVASYTAYDNVMFGCYRQTMASRFIYPQRGPGENGRCTIMEYGERRIRKDLEGNLIVVRVIRQRCSTWGSLKDVTPKEYVMGPFIFRKVE